MRMGKLILAFSCSALLVGLLFGCENTDPLEWTRVEPNITNWLPKLPIVTVGEVKKVGELEIGRVLIRRGDYRDLFAVLVIPFRKIPVGSKIEVVVVEDRRSIETISTFLVVK